MIKELKTRDEFMKSIQKNKLNVIDFWASWCGPCMNIADEYKEWSEKYKNVNFFKVNVDESKELVNFFNINCMPTFIFLKDNKLIDTVKGADRIKLIKIIKNNLEPLKIKITNTELNEKSLECNKKNDLDENITNEEINAIC